MTTTRTTASRTTRGAVGRSEEKPKTVKVRGLVLELPPTVPLRIYKQMGEIARKGDNATLADMVDALELVLNESQMEKVWSIDIPANNGTLDELQNAFAEVIDKVFEATGITPGESKASP